DAAAPTKNPTHNHAGQIGTAAGCSAPAAVAPIAAISTSAITPMTRSARITVVATVFDLVYFAVSAMRKKSPPMLLGRKLLKNSATRYDPISVVAGTRTSCASSRTCHRHRLAATLMQ